MHASESSAVLPRTVYLALGANVGNRLANLQSALSYLARYGTVAAVSRLYETAPSGVTDQPPFLNACCALETSLPLMELLADVKQVEWELGRRPSLRWGPRPIDIDILLDGATVLETPALTVPHQRMTERGFVLAPLVDIAAEAVHPVVRSTVHDLWQALPRTERESVAEVAGAEWPALPPSHSFAGPAGPFAT